MTNAVPITPLIITNISLLTFCHGGRLIVDLKYPKALTLYVLKTKPLPEHLAPGSPYASRPHRISWNSYIDRIYWAPSPDERTHWEIDFFWPLDSTTVYIQLNAADGRKRPQSKLPFFVITREYKIIFYEPWGTSLNQYNQWNQLAPAPTTITVRPGTAEFIIPQQFTSMIFTHNISVPAGAEQPTLCNTVITVDVGMVTKLFGASAQIEFGCGTSNVRYAYLYLAGDIEQTASNNAWYHLAGGPGRHQFVPNVFFENGLVLRNNHLPIPPDNAPLRTLEFDLRTGINAGEPALAILQLHQISIGQFTGSAALLRADWTTYQPPDPMQPVDTVVN